MTLPEYNQRYETILHADLTDHQKDVKFASLMTELEAAYQIPALKNGQWEAENRRVIALYRKISMSRSF